MKDKELKCIYCGKPVNDIWELHKHYLGIKHETNFKIQDNNQWIPLHDFRVKLEVTKQKIGIYQCMACKYNSNKRDNVLAHIASNHPEKVMQLTNNWSPLGIQIFGKKPLNTQRLYVKSGNYMEILDTYGNLVDYIDLNNVFENEDEIRAKLGLSNAAICCDGAVHYVSCKYSIIEDKGSNILKAVKQLSKTGEYFIQRGHDIHMQIITANRIDKLAQKKYKVVNNILYDKTANKQIAVNGKPIIFIKYGEEIHSVWNKISSVVEGR